MKNIFITQKVTADKHGTLNYVVEKNWYDFFKSKKINIIPINDVNLFVKYKSWNIAGLIVPGGNDLPSKNKNFENKIRKKKDVPIIKFALNKQIPILTVCYGFQLLADMYGYNLKKSSIHTKTTHKLNIQEINSYKNIITINSFHNYVIHRLPKFFDKDAKCKDKTIELAISTRKKILCTMFHPERKNISQKIVSKIVFNHFGLK